MIHEQYNQIAVQPNAGLTFGTVLRNIVRQDPDVIMVGEIRDYETVENAIHAALTGHLVFSTLHTNDAPSAVARLVDMGAQPFLVESTLIAVLAQRLIRKVCETCGKIYNPSPQEIVPLNLSQAEIKALTLRKGVGCTKCRGTGYYGRTAIFEIMAISDKIRQMIHNNAGAQELKKQAISEGMHTLRESAIKKMKAGITTLEEVLRVTGGYM